MDHAPDVDELTRLRARVTELEATEHELLVCREAMTRAGADLADQARTIEHLRDVLTRADFRDVGDASAAVSALVQLHTATVSGSHDNPALLEAAALIGGDLAQRFLQHFRGRPALAHGGAAPVVVNFYAPTFGGAAVTAENPHLSPEYLARLAAIDRPDAG